MKIAIMIGICMLILLVGCDGSKTFDSRANLECEDKCMEEGLNLDYTAHSGGSYICHCRKSVSIDWDEDLKESGGYSIPSE